MVLNAQSTPVEDPEVRAEGATFKAIGDNLDGG